MGVWARQIKWCPFKLLFFNYLVIFYLLEGEVGVAGDLFPLKKNCTLFMFKIKDLLLVFITGDFLSQKTPWEAY